MGQILIVGTSLPGMACAVRLAKAGHDVTVFEQGQIGGRWALPQSWPATLSVPAAWRDLFRKSGRTLEAELSARGLQLAAAPAPLYQLRDGRTLPLPTDRATQHALLRTTFSLASADAWQQALDSVDVAWQALRKLGLEADEPLTRQLWKTLRPRMDLRHLRKDVGEAGELTEVLAWPYPPQEVPAWTLTQILAERTLGCQHITDQQHRRQPLSVMRDLLVQRLETRGVTVIGERVTARTATSVTTEQGQHTADAVIDATHPWSGLAPAPRRLEPALSPRTTCVDGGSEGPEIVDLPHQQRSYSVHDGDQWRTVTLDYAHPIVDPGAGARWQGAKSWRRRPALVSKDGVFRAHAAARAGNQPWAQILTGALVTYAVHDRLTGKSIRPVDDPRKLR